MLHTSPILMALKEKLNKKKAWVQGRLCSKGKACTFFDEVSKKFFHVDSKSEQRWLNGEEVLAEKCSEDRVKPQTLVQSPERILVKLLINQGHLWGKAIDSPWATWPVQGATGRGYNSGDLAWVKRFESAGSSSSDQPCFLWIELALGCQSDFFVSKSALLCHGYSEKHRLEETPWSPPLPSESEDLTHLTFLTVDGPKTQDIDDAFCVERRDETSSTLHVAISDVSHSIQEGDLWDLEAQRLAFSLYLPGHHQPMLPKHLSESILSLHPESVREALVVSWTFRTCDYCWVQEPQIRFAKICSRFRLEYAQLSAWFNHQKWQGHTPESLSQSLISREHLNHAAGFAFRWLSKHFQDSGTFLQETPLTKIEMTSKGQVKRFGLERRDRAQKMVEALMLCANHTLTSAVKHHPDQAFIFTAHEGIVATHRAAFEEKLKNVGLYYSADELQDPRCYAVCMRLLELKSSQDPLSVWGEWRQHQRSAQNVSQPAPHFNLGFGAYGTWTSPIRKYGDLWNQRQLKRCLRGERPKKVPKDLLNHLEEMKKRGRRIERQVQKTYSFDHLKQLQRLHPHLPLAARLLRENARGWWVEILSFKLAGWIQAEELKRLLGATFEPTSGLYLDRDGLPLARLMQGLVVTLKRVDLQRMELIFQMVPASLASL